MADYRTMYDRNYLYAYDLAGKEVTLTIDEVKASELQGSDGKKQKKPTVFFRELRQRQPADNRSLVLCKTNGKTIAAMYGNDTKEWIGKRITLYAAMVSSFGSTVEAIRIRPTVPKAKANGTVREPDQAPQPEVPEMFDDEQGGEA